jgi:hypothetical protein
MNTGYSTPLSKIASHRDASLGSISQFSSSSCILSGCNPMGCREEALFYISTERYIPNGMECSTIRYHIRYSY